MTAKHIQVVSIGKIAFEEAWQLQREIFERVRKQEMPSTVLMLEHFPVYTLGKTAQRSHLLLSEAALRAEGISVFEIDRGGDITFHGPGQFVAYPILNMNEFYLDVHRYLRDLEEVIIRLLQTFGIFSERKISSQPGKSFTGVWVGNAKICAMGVRFSHWTTMHGLALNVRTDLKFFGGIIPCGIRDKEVTSMRKIASRDFLLKEIEACFLQHFQAVFNVVAKKISFSEVKEQVGGDFISFK
ncbi:lipoate-protein ligase B [Chloroherpeton thalassium ATCC 35110]|uniref:Octanoyltransferase n=1 Tax=Chloroherpeton thalassium (strain ATCC 35110 / GB-78) TaxID=517418 RepID=B3QUJ5_CHLT3|nr:lipoyl(octanoyl) transferase LipB [Chloroherpeton thalassium]ACF12901.1 lipoate-protein ligase B [Chloroherpeton thalassium ATCC 35110]